jgi:hypothetical protein
MPSLSSHALRLVVFGMPDAGKSSLLGALAQAAQTQEHLLNGHLTDTSKGLDELERRLYEGRPRETLEEVAPYPVVLEPFVPPGSANSRLEAVLIDCDGRVANELLARRRSLLADSSEGSLAEAVLNADALLLVVDASASPAQVESDFTEFGRFLRLLEQSRGRRSDIGGLPVFLVLTKCDLLAQPTDTPATWIERIEERKRQLGVRFHEFLNRQNVEGPVTFGRVQLHLWATAVKRPPLVDTPAKPREPYGVGELFRQAFEQAQSFQTRSRQAGRRLVWTVAGSVGVLAGMASLAVGLLVNRPQDDPGARELLGKVDSYRAREPLTPSNRLREPLQPRISELTDLANDPDFGKLPQEKRDYVESHLRELQDYRGYQERLRLPTLETVRTERALDDIEARLQELALPAEHKTDWSQTEAFLARAQALADVRALRTGVGDQEEWYRRLLRRGEELWAFREQKSGAPISWADWQAQVQALFDESETPPHRADDKLPGSALTYQTALRFDRVRAIRDEWEKVKQRLIRVRDLSTALGLAGALSGRSPLDLTAGFGVEQSAGRLSDLEQFYPRYREEFTLADLPEAAAAEIRRAARVRYDHAIKAGQRVVLRHLQEASPEGGDSAEAWRKVRAWLASPEELQAWRVLATVLARLQNVEGTDPVTALNAFLGKDRFDLVLRRLVLEIPDDKKIRPAGKLLIHHRSSEEDRPNLVFELLGDERHDARKQVMRYTFQPTAGISLAYRPGDLLWADLPVKSGDETDWVLTWASSHSPVYQFERLVQPPRLHRMGQSNLEGQLQEGIRLETHPEDGVPKVPDLMPIVTPLSDKP